VAPTHTIATSCRRASSTAPSPMSPTQLTPTRSIPATRRSRRARSLARRDRIGRGSRVPVQQHLVHEWPTTATDFTFVRSSGSRPAEFLRRTIDFRVTSRTRRASRAGPTARDRRRRRSRRRARARGIPQSEADRHAEQPSQGLVDVGLREQASLDRLRHGFLVPVEKVVDPGLDTRGGAVGRSG